MPKSTITEMLRRGPVHLVGIKGTGMSALAELLTSAGVPVTGSDTDEQFYTDRILKDLGIPFREDFSGSNIPANTALVVRSAAYSAENNTECAAAENLRLPMITYPEAVAAFSGGAHFAGIAGIHGKTTTAAMTGTILKEARLPVSVLVGSAVPAFGGRSTMTRGDEYFVAETCEYRRHFLSFRPRWIVVTNIEADHLDYFKDAGDVLDAFTEYALLLPPGGSLIYCADDPGALELSRRVHRRRRDLHLLPYGFSAEGPYGISSFKQGSGAVFFTLAGEGEFEIALPGRHMAQNAAAALALSRQLLTDHFGSLEEGDLESFRRGLRSYSGCRRRSEILGEAGGILFIDDYGHHPTEIRSTLTGYREFYPGRRIIVDFMSHTYSRTEKLLDDFARAFDSADMVILHRIYASAREEKGIVDGRRLYKETAARHDGVVYFHEVMDAEDFCLQTLAAGDVFITMGAGNNWALGHKLLKKLSEREKG